MLNERELHARYEIMVETYNKTVNVEGQLMVLMANRYILPAALEYQKQVAQSVSAVKSAGGKSVEGKKLLDKLTKLTDKFKANADKLEKALAHEGSGSAEKHAKHFRDNVIPAMAALRDVGRRARDASSRTSCGRSRRIGRCCLSSSPESEVQSPNSVQSPGQVQSPKSGPSPSQVRVQRHDDAGLELPTLDLGLWTVSCLPSGSTSTGSSVSPARFRSSPVRHRRFPPQSSRIRRTAGRRWEVWFQCVTPAGTLENRSSGPKCCRACSVRNVPACSGPATNYQKGSKSLNCARTLQGAWLMAARSAHAPVTQTTFRILR